MRQRIGRVAWGIVSVLGGLCSNQVCAESRFPKPQFESAYTAPTVPNPPVQELLAPWADVAMLALALTVATVLIYRVRSRRWILVFSGFSLLFFGFVRQGCLCPVGATQNVVAAAWQGGGLPVYAAAIFVLPLLFALFFGRVFCGAVCPLGMLQEFFVIHPVQVPRRVDAVLRLIPITVLGIGIVAAVNGAGYLICRSDPFVGLFRRSAPLSMILVGVAVLLVGMVIARPYCRYFCPYGVLLEWCARVGWKRFEITQETCINCRLCTGVCPVQAIVMPREPLPERARTFQFRRFVRLMVLAPVVVAGGCVLGWLAGRVVASAHPDVIQQAAFEQAARNGSEEGLVDIEAARRNGANAEVVAGRAAATVARFRLGTAWAGGFLGFVVALRMLQLTRLRRLTQHEADRIRCVACGRCYPACPKNLT